MPYVRLVHGRMVVNPGSVGMPYGRAGAHWALLGAGAGISLRRTAYDIDEAIAQVTRECDFADPEDPWGLTSAQAWAEHYLRSKTTDADALAVMAPRDGLRDGRRDGR